MLDRRQLLASGLGALAASSPAARAAARVLRIDPTRAGEAAPCLVLIQLAGGNDGLSTLVPHADDAYHRARPRTAIAADAVLDLDGYVGLAPELAGLRRHLDEGRLGVVQGVGYPEPNRSHFESFEIWHTAHASGRLSGPGWVGRLCDARHGEEAESNRLVHVGGELPYSLHSSRHPALSFATPRTYRWARNEPGAVVPDPEPVAASDSEPTDNLDFLRGVLRDARGSSHAVRAAVARYRPSVDYEGGGFAQALGVCAALIDARIGCEVLSAELGGFDTHDRMEPRHRALRVELDRGLTAFLDDLAANPAAANTLVLVFSEFGRRVAENGSQGTDHGTAGPLFVAGPRAVGGLHGEHPSLTDLDDRGDMRHTTDFRSVYRAAIEGLWDADAEAVLGARYPRLDVVAKPERA